MNNVEDPKGLPKDVQKIISTKLISGAEITHPVWLMGGGQTQKKYFLEAIGDKNYKNAFEWCAGHGEIGFELITAGICETLAFSDLHPSSEEWCLKNAVSLNLTDRVTAYTTPVIARIPEHHKWDLVVGNPPNSIDIDPTSMARFRRQGLSDDHVRLFARTTWDIGFVAHREFFQNIGNYITQDADLFISVHNTLIKHVVNISNGFEIVKIFDMFPDNPGLKVVHFRQKNVDRVI